MDLLNSALGLHEDMRNGTKPVPIKGGAGSRGIGGAGGSGHHSRQGSGSGGGPPRAGGEDRNSEDLRDFLAPAEGGPPAGAGGVEVVAEGVGNDQRASGGSSAASLRLYQLPAVKEACGGFDPKRCIGEGGFGKVYRGSMMGLPVAVKKLDETGLQGREQFFREVEVGGAAVCVSRGMKHQSKRNCLWSIIYSLQASSGRRDQQSGFAAKARSMGSVGRNEAGQPGVPVIDGSYNPKMLQVKTSQYW